MAKKLGLAMQYPEGYLESQQANGKGSSGEEEEEKQVKKRGKKRKSSGECVSQREQLYGSDVAHTV